MILVKYTSIKAYLVLLISKYGGPYMLSQPSSTDRLKISVFEKLLVLAIQKSDMKTFLQALKLPENFPHPEREIILTKALHLCVSKGTLEIENEDILEILIQKGAKIQGDADFSPLHDAIKKENLKMVKKLVAAGANISDILTSIKLTPLQLSLLNRNTEIFDFLLASGANADYSDNQTNLIDFLFSVRDVPQSLIQHVENKIGFNKNVLDEIAENFQNILKKESIQASKLGKKLFIIVSEPHNVFKILQVETQLLSVAKKFGIDTLFLELPRDYVKKFIEEKSNMTPCLRNLRNFAKDSLGLQLKGIDDHPFREDETFVQERNRVMAERINFENEAGIFFTGSAHLLGLLTDPVSKINRNIFHIVPFNLSKLFNKHISDEICSTLLSYSLPGIDGIGKFSGNPDYVIQLLEDLSFSASEEVSILWNSNKEISLDIYKQPDEKDLEKLRKDPNLVLMYALKLKSLYFINLSIKMGANIQPYLFEQVNRNNIENVCLLHQAGANLNLKYNNTTALHYAIICDHVDMVKTLIQLGADINLTDKNGRTACELAEYYNLSEIHNIIVSSQKQANTFSIISELNQDQVSNTAVVSVGQPIVVGFKNKQVPTSTSGENSGLEEKKRKTINLN